MRFGIVLPTFCYNPQRQAWATAGFESLAKTQFNPSVAVGDGKPVLMLMVKGEAATYQPPVDPSRLIQFVFEIQGQSDKASGTEQTLAYGTQYLLDTFERVTHVVWMGDDALFNPRWLIELEELIERHPDAKAWSVYRSAHVAYHAPLRFEGDDVLVRSLCGHGMTFTRDEWKEWGIDWRQGQRWPVPSGGNTLDLHHAFHRPGERWCTAKSFVQHTGRVGVNCTPYVPEWAEDFQAE